MRVLHAIAREEVRVGKGEEIKMQGSRACWLAIIVTRNTGAARSGKANRLYLNGNSATLGGQKEMRTVIFHIGPLSPEKTHITWYRRGRNARVLPLQR